MNKTLFHKLPRVRPPWLIQAEQVEEQARKEVDELRHFTPEQLQEKVIALEAAALWREDCERAYARGETPASLLEAKWS
jgi:hypothetical protein